MPGRHVDPLDFSVVRSQLDCTAGNHIEVEERTQEPDIVGAQGLHGVKVIAFRGIHGALERIELGDESQRGRVAGIDNFDGETVDHETLTLA